MPPRARGEIQLFWRTFSRNQLACVGGVVVAVLVLMAVFAPVLAPYDPYRIQPDVKKILQPPSRVHLLGTDQIGRDVLSRILYGARGSLAGRFVSGGRRPVIRVAPGAR